MPKSSIYLSWGSNKGYPLSLAWNHEYDQPRNNDKTAFRFGKPESARSRLLAFFFSPWSYTIDIRMIVNRVSTTVARTYCLSKQTWHYLLLSKRLSPKVADLCWSITIRVWPNPSKLPGAENWCTGAYEVASSLLDTSQSNCNTPNGRLSIEQWKVR